MATQTEELSRLVAPEAFVRTYNTPGYADPWDAVIDFRSVVGFATQHPNYGSTRISSHFDLPRGRVRGWMNGSRPDCVHGMQTAEDKGWLHVEIDSRRFRGLNALLSWVFSGGSIIEDTKVPYFTVRQDDIDELLLKRAGAWAGVQLDMTRHGGDGRSREYRPTASASVFGRVLLVLGAPLGDKNPENLITLPEYLDHAPQRVRREFLQIYLRNRGSEKSDVDLMQFRENRSQGYLRSLASLFRAETGESVTVSDRNVILSVAATQALRSWEPPLEFSMDKY